MYRIAAACAVFVGAVGIHVFLLDRPLLAESVPFFTGPYLLQTCLIMTGSWLLISGLKALSSGDRIPAGDYLTDRSEWGHLTFKTEFPFRLWSITFTAKECLAGLMLLASGLCLLLFLYKPVYYSRFAVEDNFVEYFSAAFCFAASGIFMGAAALLLRSRQNGNGWRITGTATLALLLFLIGMEEVSWFQRFVGLETPVFLQESNMQRELNFHNLDTNLSENAYYFATFVLLILIPFLRLHFAEMHRRPLLAFFMPGELLLLASAVTVAYTYNMWNVPLMQAGFFLTIFILWYSRLALADKRARTLCTIVFATAVVTQALHLLFGGRTMRLWDVTEYRELFMPACLLLYSLEMLLRATELRSVQRTKIASHAVAA